MIVMEIEGGNILESKAQTLITTVNTVGVMGKGLALAFKESFPGLYPSYKQACDRGIFKRDGFFVYEVDGSRKIVCMPTKRHWRYPSKIEWIDESLYRLAHDYMKYGITSLAVPALGCGEGRLKWEDVYPLIVRYLDRIEIPVAVYLPSRRV